MEHQIQPPRDLQSSALSTTLGGGVGIACAGAGLAAFGGLDFLQATGAAVRAALELAEGETSIPGIITAAAASAGGYLGWLFDAPAPGIEHVRGRQVRMDTQSAAHFFKKDFEYSKKGIHIHPKIQISIDRETKGFLALGAPGSGKTIFLINILNQIIKRGDKVILYDNKGDFTQGLLGMPGVQLFAPWDSRSICWDIAGDNASRTDSYELASQLIQEGGNDPTWSNGARSILGALIAYYQKELPGKWSFQNLVDSLSAEYSVLRNHCITGNPIIARLLPEKPSKTTDSLLFNVVSYFNSICFLADSENPDGHGGPIKRFSIRRWLLDGGKTKTERETNILILQGHGKMANLTRDYIQSLIYSLAGLVNSPDFPDSKTRRIWLIIDEFPQLGKIDKIEKFLEIGRSKGIRVILAAQDISQIREVYSDNWANTLSSMMGTTIIGQVGGVETPDWCEKLIGTRWIKRYNPSHSGQDQGIGGMQNQTRTDNKQQTEEPVLAASELAGLGPTRHGVEVVLNPRSPDFIWRLIWPFAKLPGPGAPASMPAPWTRPGWPAAIDAVAAARPEPIGDEGQEPGAGDPPKPATPTRYIYSAPGQPAAPGISTMAGAPEQATKEKESESGEDRAALDELTHAADPTGALAALSLINEFTQPAEAGGEIRVSAGQPQRRRLKRRAELEAEI